LFKKEIKTVELIIFISLQAAGKSSFYQEKFIDTHIRINLDMLKTRHREKILFNACLEAKQSLVIDNTNPTIEDRKRYIIPAQEKAFKIIGYYFKSNLEDCKQRNDRCDRDWQERTSRAIPLVGILATRKKLQLPSYQEGFDKLYYVSIGSDNLFTIEDWNGI
jgi:predicted kinase